MQKRISVLIFFIFCASLFCACGDNKKTSGGIPKNAVIEEDAEKAYVFGFPAVLMHLNEKVMTNPVKGSGNVALNQFRHNGYINVKNAKNILPDADFLYSAAWVEVVKEPVVFEIPDMKGRYAVFSIMDAWTNITASLGKRTTGTAAQKYLITPPAWTGTIPEDMTQIKAPTNMVFISAKIQVNGSTDVKAASAIQKALKLTPLENYGDRSYKPAEVAADGYIDMSPPLEQLFNMRISEYFNLLNALMADNPPYDIDSSFLNSVKYLKIAPGEEFDLSVFDEEKQNELTAIPQNVKKRFEEIYLNPEKPDGWIISPFAKMSPDTDYEKRALNVYKGIDIDLPADIIKMQSFTDLANDELDGKNKYIIRFNKDFISSDELFWSISAYNDKSLFSENPVNRYSVSSGKKLNKNKDGSFDIYIQNENPGKAKESNWLPAPKGKFSLVFRVYCPDDKMKGGSQVPPAVEKQ